MLTLLLAIHKAYLSTLYGRALRKTVNIFTEFSHPLLLSNIILKPQMVAKENGVTVSFLPGVILRLNWTGFYLQPSTLTMVYPNNHTSWIVKYEFNCVVDRKPDYFIIYEFTRNENLSQLLTEVKKNKGVLYTSRLQYINTGT